MKRQRLSLRSLFVVVLSASAAFGVACVGIDTYVYSAQKYDPTNDCVAQYQSIEVIDGKGAKASCPKSCLLVNGELYVSTMCPPLPSNATAVAPDAADCIAATKAAACSAEPEEGGSEGGDASGDGAIEAGDDARTPDAGTDAADASDTG